MHPKSWVINILSLYMPQLLGCTYRYCITGYCVQYSTMQYSESRPWIGIQYRIAGYWILSKGGTLWVKNWGNTGLSLVRFQKYRLSIGWDSRIFENRKIYALTSTASLGTACSTQPCSTQYLNAKLSVMSTASASYNIVLHAVLKYAVLLFCLCGGMFSYWLSTLPQHIFNAVL